MPDTITFHLDSSVLVYLHLRLSIGFGFPMVFRLPVLIRFQFLEVSPIQRGTEPSNLASEKSLSDLFPGSFRFSRVSSAFGLCLTCFLVPSHWQKIQNLEASWSLGTGSSSFRSTYILYCANSASNNFIGLFGFLIFWFF